MEALDAAACVVGEAAPPLPHALSPMTAAIPSSHIAGAGRLRSPCCGRRPIPAESRCTDPEPKADLAHYSELGFETSAYAGSDEYGFAERDGAGLHLAANRDHDPAHAASTYLYVRDADALYDQWSRPGIGGHTLPVGPTPYKLREGSHIDPDGNLIRFGSPMEVRPPPGFAGLQADHVADEDGLEVTGPDHLHQGREGLHRSGVTRVEAHDGSGLKSL